MKSNFITWMLVILTGLSVFSASAEACGGGRPRCYSPCGGGGHGGGYVAGGWGAGVVQGPRGNMFAVGAYGRPLLIGRGAVAFRRGNRLHRRSRRAAFFGFYGRANRLAFRGDAAYNRGFIRNSRWW